MKRFLFLGVAAGVALMASACGTTSGPDEFRVVRKAPLVLPPDYNLRPPKPGESRPQDLLPDAQARIAVFGNDLGRDASPGEKLFIKQAGADATDRSVRSQVDFDDGQILRKNRSFADMILNFGKPASTAQPVVDAAAEADRLKTETEAVKDVTGGQPVVIKPKHATKLPGL
ncbi:MAG TPA: DUF3035 domain-containing protein [Hyphomonadaceae bacterium]|nr:DUF3035 domain-containing protein [Hyphomonadaceae bacterium]